VWIDDLIEKLVDFAPEGAVFNPWRSVDPLDAFENACEQRQGRLRAHFDVPSPRLCLVGEAAGFQGLHFSGVPFTSEALLFEGAIPRICATPRLTSRPRPWSEPSARIVWKTLYDLGIAEQTVLWNTFAFHPFKEGEPYTNRKPSKREIETNEPILRFVLEHFQSLGARVVAVGRVAEAAMLRLGIEVASQVQHPAYGGSPKFRAGLAQIARQSLG